MTVSSQISPQLLTKPPRLLQSGQGYDWKEFDRWLQKVYVILGAPQNTDTFNITNLDTSSGTAGGQLEPDFIIDQSLEIQLLRRTIEQLTLEIDMLQNQQQEVLNTKKMIEDIKVEMDMIQNQQQEIINLSGKINDAFVELGAY